MSDIQSQTDVFFIRRQMAETLPPPRRTSGPIGWARANLFGSAADALLTIIGIVIAVAVLVPLVEWAFVNATWTGDNREACAANTIGACWAFVRANLGQFIYGRYPDPERWRVNVFFVLMAAGIIPLAIPSAPFKGLNLLYVFIIFPVVSGFLLLGGALGLPEVETALWGGLFLTLVVSYVGMALSLPFGILLALGRRSDMPAVHYVSVFIIEVCRGVPLITVLFMAGILLPLFFPTGVNFDKLLRALFGVSLFASAYMAEVIRGGLQAVPKGQYEGAKALGLGYWQMTRLIILPQAIKIVIPGIVNTFIGLFKDTSLVYIISIFELLSTVRNSFSNPDWATSTTPASGLAFAAIVFWIFCFGMSQYSRFIERRLNTGHRR
ncbi:MAG TPA: amino acid ABC transporter permease [Devosia sp.]|nr:amino acid ABC transporter permease [Devosia sp.]